MVDYRFFLIWLRRLLGERGISRAGAIVTIGAIILGGALVTNEVIRPKLSNPTAGTANIWVDTNGGTCTRSGSLVDYVDASACGSLNAAYQAASAGDVVGVRTGTYSGETVAYRAGMDDLSPACDPFGVWGSISTANCVKFIPDGGNVCIDGSLAIKGSSVWISGTATGSAPDFPGRTYDVQIDNGSCANFADTSKHGDLQVGPGVSGSSEIPDHVIVEGLHSHTFNILGANHVAFRDDDFGPNMRNEVPPYGNGDCDSGQNNIENFAGTVPTDYLFIQRSYVHGQNGADTNSDSVFNCHPGGIIYVFGNVGNVMFDNDGFAQNAVYDMEFGAINANHTFSDWTIQNSYFGCVVDPGIGNENTCTGRNNIELTGSDVYSNWLVRFNSFYSWIRSDGSSTGASFRFLGNVLQQPAPSAPSDGFCTDTDFVKNYNVWFSPNFGAAGTCGDPNGSADNSRASIYTTPGSASAPDFHLVDGSNVANDFVSPTSADYALTTDFEGQARSAPRDAGADER